MFAKSVFEPIEDGSELNEGKESGGEFIITSIDATMTFDSAEEVFNAMAPAVEASKEGAGAATALSSGDAGRTPDLGDVFTQAIGIEAFVGHQGATAQEADVLVHRSHIVARSLMQAQADSVTVTVHHGGKLGVESTLGLADRLIQPIARRIGPVLVNFDICRVDITGRPSRTRGQCGQYSRPQTAGTPSSPP